VSAPFAYYGGKKKIAAWLAGLCPLHCLYVEPFAGGAGLFWARERTKVGNADAYREVLNDTNQAIVTVYEALRDDAKEVERVMSLIPYGETAYREAVRVYRGESDNEPLATRAAYLLFYWSCSFAGKAGGGIKRARTSENPAMTWANKLGKVSEWTERLRGVYVEDVDYRLCMTRWDSPGTLHYCDPPYVDANQGHYSGWTNSDRRELFEFVDTLQGSVMISGYLDAWCLTYAGDRGWAVHSKSVAVSAGREKAARVETVVIKPASPAKGSQVRYLSACAAA